MTNRRLREDLNDINTHYQELISVSKEALRRKKQTQNQFKELNQTIQHLTQQNERLSKKVEDLEEEEGLDSKQVHSKKGHSVILESSPGKDKVTEQPKVFSTERDRSLEDPIEEVDKDEEDVDLIFRKMNIPWLSDKTYTTKEGLRIDSKIENL